MICLYLNDSMVLRRRNSPTIHQIPTDINKQRLQQKNEAVAPYSESYLILPITFCLELVCVLVCKFPVRGVIIWSCMHDTYSPKSRICFALCFIFIFQLLGPVLTLLPICCNLSAFD